MYNYSREPRHVIFMIDNKSFYASVEAIQLGLNPLKAILVVMSEAENTNGGLVLASSPMAKKLFGISNVTRRRDLPNDPRLIIVSPRMNLYIKYNLAINKIFQKFAAEEDIHPYSIDESLIDMNSSWKLFGNSPYEVARKIQLKIKSELGLYVTVGIGDNPLLAKLALDLEAKHTHSLIGEWHYEDLADKLWPITDLTSVWSIGKRTAAKLNKMGINTMYDLAHYNPYILKDKMGVIGSQLFAFSWGIDRALIRDKYHAVEKSYGNSQVLPRDYDNKQEIEIILREIAEQVGARIRAHHLAATEVSLHVGFSLSATAQVGHAGFGHSTQITATNNNNILAKTVVQLFEEKWKGESVRNLAVSYSQLVPDSQIQLDLFDTNQKLLKQYTIDHTVDQIRQKYGFKSIVKLSSLVPGATAINRDGLVGGHAGGNAYE
ncbi:Y-family DNA polymerase [Lactobacillus sp. XV13L]|nr:Y-family DNA polymerase [Lactobacillus sp. XV13L]